MRPVVRTGRKMVNWLYVAAQLVGDGGARVTEPGRRPAQDPLCSRRIPARLHQNIVDISCRVDRAPEPACLAADQDDHRVQILFVVVSTKPVTVPTDNYVAPTLSVMSIYISNSLSSRSVSLRKRRPI